MARGAGLGKELRKIEAEERKIEREEKAIECEEKAIEEKEDLLRVFEELGLMRWKSYYILTAGAILLLALTFVSALWIMNDQLATIEQDLTSLSASIRASTGSLAGGATQRDWCPAGQTMTINVGAGPTTISIIGKEMRNETEMCHGTMTIPTEEGQSTMDIWIDQLGSVEILPAL